MSDLFFYSNKESLGNNHLQGILFGSSKNRTDGKNQSD